MPRSVPVPRQGSAVTRQSSQAAVGAWGSLACAPAPPQAGGALGQGLAPHHHPSRSKLSQGSSQQESPCLETSLLGWKWDKRKSWPEEFANSITSLF